MTKKERFALKMADGAEVRNIDDFKTHFDIDLVTEYFFDGRLLTWLEDRYYDEEATEIKKLSSDDERLEQKLCKIFDKETPEEIARRERLNRLKKYTDDETILSHVDKVAFDQEELADLLDEDAKEIFLCENRFVIPLRMTDKNYIGVSKAVAVIRRSEPVNFDELNITFKNVAFDDDYQKILPPPTVAPPTEDSNADKIETPEITEEINTTIKNPTEDSNTDKIETPEITEEINTTIKNFNSAYAAAFVHTAKKFTATIRLKAKNKTVDAKSVLRIMTISWGKSNKVTVTAKGSDAKQAVDALKDLIDLGFPGASLKNHKDYSEIIFAPNNDMQESQAAIFWQKANAFKSEVNLKGKDKFGNDEIIDAKNIQELITTKFKSGEELKLAAEGEDARQTVSALKKLIDSDFPESSAKGGNCVASTITVGNLNRTSGDSAAILVQVARKFKSNIFLRASGVFVDAKNLLSVVDLGFVKGAKVILIAKGEDSRQSVNALKKLIDSGFPESSAKGGDCAATTITIGSLNNTSDDSAIALVQTAKKFKAKIWLKKKYEFIEAKELLSVINIDFRRGNTVNIAAEGSDAKKAVDALKNLIDSGFPAPSVKDNEICAATTTIIDREVKNYGGAICLLNETANKFKAKIWIKTVSVERGKYPLLYGGFAEAKRDLEGVVLNYDAEIKIVAVGSDARQAVSAIKSVIDSGFPGASDKYTGLTRATTVITNATGICARPASVFVQKASSFKSKIQLKAKGKIVDAKSILMIMSMGLVRGTVVTIVADGPDAQDAVATLKKLIDDKFGYYE